MTLQRFITSFLGNALRMRVVLWRFDRSVRDISFAVSTEDHKPTKNLVSSWLLEAIYTLGVFLNFFDRI